MTTPAAEGPPVRVKICGLRDEATLDAALAAGADWIGFQQFERSPRYITPDRVATLVRHMDRRARSVVLFVEPTDDEVARLLGRVTPDVLQIYASEDRACALRERFGVPVWHARGVAVAADLPHATPVDGL
ncbi:phosphoribosylanthranilate isomerase, partial [Ameyamaea chiangmaiensis]|nr:N-(5'-phosphoribosyl)anthranilate isomerase [Ameyamaea chiangmaiensis]